ncbi:MAG: transcriptional repressor NrdR [Clostridia bacterium]|nr:transcriptional repressor NrdR [Clostridia bacterium]MBR3295954.1 transcriptional repressor NrdR [Clostridia bacterium]
MKCVYCGCLDSKVVDSRPLNDGATIRRRRECLECGKRFTTYEKSEQLPVMVIKRDGSREIFDLEKIQIGLRKACDKRKVSAEQIQNMALEVERRVQELGEQEVPARTIGDMVMDVLKDVDEVAYIRFASVYREFKDVTTFMEEITKLVSNKQ